MAAAGLAVGPTAQVAAAPTARVAAAPGMNAPKAAPAYEAVCGPVPAPIARCASLRRTDIAAVPAMAPGTAADAIGTPLASVSGYGPADLRSAYNLPSSGGSGRTVAIVDAYDLPTAASDLAVYRAQFGLPACTTASGCFRKVNQRGGTTYPAFNGGWAGEIELDLDMVSATCPGCKILLVEADTANLSDLGAAVDMAVKLGAVAVSNSYGAPEWGTESAMDPHYNHPGVAITASTGDWGYQYGVEYPAASAYVMSVGGTSLELAANARGWTETVWATSSAFATGSGCSLYEPKPYWQTDPDCANRIAADVSAVADPDTGVAVYDRNGGGWTIYGGTSTSAPIIAATYALAGQPAAGSYPGRLLYDSAASLWDVTAGSNGPCDGDPSYFCQAAVGYDGPTGLGTPNGSSAFVPDILDLGAGTRTSCALTSAGKLSCWGFGSAGEASAPAGTYVALSTGDSHSCAIDTAGALHCWGDDSFGQSTPPAGSYRTVSGGGVNSCAIGSDSTLRCWGDTSHGVASPPSGTYTAVSVGLYHACAVNTSAGLRCWGDNSHGQASAPTGTYIAVAAGQYHTCALAGSGAISCWGDNSHGQLNHPAGSYLDLDAGSSGACAVKLDGSLSCWGDNSSGQNSPPGALASRVALGTTHGCAYFATAIECWGGNADGEGIPLFATTSLPVAGSGYPYATDITLSSAVVPTPTFSVTGSLPSGISLSSTGHLAGTSSTPGSYPFSVTASNGIAPAATQALTLVVDASPVPGVPTSVAVIASDTTAVVTWAAPIPNGGSTITGYTVSSSPPATGCVITLPAALTCSFSGLTNHSPYTFSVTATNAEGTGPAASATATPLFGATYVPVTPNRLVDSRLDSHSGKRLGLGASLHAGTSAEFVVINRSGDPHLNIPASAIAVTGNLTVTNQGSSGFLALTPDNPGGMPGTSTLNFPRGDNRANAVTVALSPTGTLWVTYVGAPGTMADAIFDVTGYFVANSSGSTYVSLTPNRLVDSRLDPHSGKRLGLGASLHVGSPAWFTVVDQKPSDPTQNVPANATAVTGNLTVTNQSSSGFLALTPTKPSGTPTTSTLNFPKGDNRANAVTVPLSGGKLWVTLVGKSGSTADVIFDVTGYFVADASGATYVALTPNRLVDSRLDPHSGKRLGLGASLTSGTAAEFTAVDRSLDPRLNVPSGSVAVTGNLTVTNQGSSGFLALTPEDPRGMPATSTLNFPKGDNRANAVTVALSPTGTLWVTFISKGGTLTDVIFDVTGYFAP
jgi:hypothetical protein